LVSAKKTKILLLSDTHSYMDERILEFASGVDVVLHAGDMGAHESMDRLEAASKQTVGVYGNIDDHIMRRRFPLHQKFKIGGMKIWMTHIGGYPPNYNLRVRETIKKEQPDIFICGHSHILKVINDPKIQCLHMNPGAAGQHGFHKVRTMLRFEIHQLDPQKKGRIENLEVIELGNRGQLR
jgi:putative phosphoesterase